jgi:hypothetical protein
VSTPLLVEQDEAGLVMRYRLAQRGEGCGHLNALEGCWRVVPGEPCVRLWRDGGGSCVGVDVGHARARKRFKGVA